MPHNLEAIKQLYKLMKPGPNDSVCAYCGARATDHEHVTPKIYFNLDGKPHLKHHKAINNLVLSCKECNSLAQAKVFDNFWEKKQYIAMMMRKRYKKLLAHQVWNQSELRTLTGKLKVHVFARDQLVERIAQRIKNLDKPEICGVTTYFDDI